MKTFRYLMAFGLIWFSGNAAAIDIQHWRTANGARVYFVAAPQLPIVSLHVGFDAGSARDPAGKSGLARMVKATIAEGARGRDSQAIAEGLDGVGARYKSENGRDMFVFELRSLTDPRLLDQAISIFGDVITAPDFPQSAIDRERRRVLVSLEQQDQSPGDLVQRVFYKTVFAGHAYANPPDGSEKEVGSVTRDDIVDFHRRYFVGANAVVALVGDVTRERAAQLAEQAVGRLPRGNAAPQLHAVPDLKSANEVRIDFPSNQSHLLMGQPGISRHDPDYFPLYVGNYILGGSGLISRLAVDIREQRGLAYSVYSYFIPMRERGPFIVGLQTRNDQSSVAEKLARETVARFISEGPTAEELLAAKKNITGGFPLLLDSNEKIAGNLLTIGFYDLPLNYLDTYPSKVEAVTVEQVRDAFRRRVNPERLVRVVVGGASH